MFWSAMVSRSFFTSAVTASQLLGATGNGVDIDGRLAEQRGIRPRWIESRQGFFLLATASAPLWQQQLG